jgi:S1-C subfamily serine protease
MDSKRVIKSVLMLECIKDNVKGTGFVLSGGGIVTTNSHVVGSCSAQELVGISSVAEDVKFVDMKTDPNRDLALLCPSKPLPFSLELNGDENPPVETEVETWGYPLSHDGPDPLLSRGYVAGYRLGKDTQTGNLKNPPVRHLIVNGALNPGNSGGSLIDRTTGKVIGIVVQKWTLFSPSTSKVIDGLQQSKTTTLGGVQVPDANGVMKGVPKRDRVGDGAERNLR